MERLAHGRSHRPPPPELAGKTAGTRHSPSGTRAGGGGITPILRVRSYIWKAALAAGLAGLAILFLYPHFKRIERRGGSAPVVTAEVLPKPVALVTQAIADAFREGASFGQDLGQLRNISSYQPRLKLFRAGEALFPDDFQLRATSGKNPQLQRYAELPSEQKKNDFYLYEVTGDYYWPSKEYFYRGHPVSFRSSFIIHVAPDANGGTRVEVLEYLPTIWAGERYGFSAHAPWPYFIHDIRVVEPTNSERFEILAKIKQVAANP